jgi:hypothetical protein
MIVIVLVRRLSDHHTVGHHVGVAKIWFAHKHSCVSWTTPLVVAMVSSNSIRKVRHFIMLSTIDAASWSVPRCGIRRATAANVTVVPGKNELRTLSAAGVQRRSSHSSMSGCLEYTVRSAMMEAMIIRIGGWPRNGFCTNAAHVGVALLATINATKDISDFYKIIIIRWAVGVIPVITVHVVGTRSVGASAFSVESEPIGNGSHQAHVHGHDSPKEEPTPAHAARK